MPNESGQIQMSRMCGHLHTSFDEAHRCSTFPERLRRWPLWLLKWMGAFDE